MFAANPATAQIGQSLHYLFMGGAIQPSFVPNRTLRMGISQVLWRDGSTVSRNIALGLMKANTEEGYGAVVSALADRFSQNAEFAGMLTAGVAEKAQHNEAFARDLFEAARTSYENLIRGGEEIPPSSDSRRKGRRSDAPYASVWEASLDRIISPEV